MTDVLPFGDRGLLLRLADRHEVLGWFADLQSNPVMGQQDLVPADGTLLVLLEDGRQRAPALTELRQRQTPERAQRDSGPAVVLPVVYDGQDLEAVADLLGISPDGVVARHTSQVWTVAFTGFTPGFGYLIGDHGGLDVPRLPSPRTRVPAGAVALAAGYSAVYPRESPGGWQLIGRSDAPMWNLDRDPPALLVPGTRARFSAVRTVTEVAAPRRSPPRMGGAGLRVERPGPLTVPVDEGRPGYAHLGVPSSGAADRGAYRTANALVGNPDGAAALEVTLGGLVVTAIGDQVLVLAGADAALRVRGPHGERDVLHRSRFVLRNGERLSVGTARSGLRCYLAVAGGVDMPGVLGSRSSDTLSGLGPAPLARGELVPVGSQLSGAHQRGPADSAAAAEGQSSPQSVDGRPSTQHPTRAGRMRGNGSDVPLTVTLGPAAEGESADTLGQLLGRSWTVTPQSNRIGLRLAGATITETARTEPRSAPLVPGAVQLPPSGEPVVFLRDHPTTGGYPVVAVLTDDSIDVAAQLRPGDRVIFRRAPAPAPGSSPAGR
jgi:KipI family sensor histidine kinase inhibitor